MTAKLQKKRITISLFKNRFDTTPKPQAWTLKELQERLTSYRVTSDKNGEMISFAHYGSRKNENGGLRHNRNVLGHSGIIVDIDCKDSAPLSRKDIQRRMGSLYYIAHTTYSSTQKHPRWHVFVPFSDEVDAKHYEAAFHLFNNRLGKTIDNVSKGLSTPYYLPMCPRQTKAEFQCFVNPGELFDARQLGISEDGVGKRGARSQRRHGQLEDEPVGGLPAVDVEDMAISEQMRALIVTGDATGFDGDRSSLAYHVITELLLQGFVDEQIAAVLRNATYGISARHREKGRRWTLDEIKRVRSKLGNQRYVQGVEPHYPEGDARSPRSAAQRLQQLIAQFFEAPDLSVGIRAPAGQGKTTDVIQRIAQRSPGAGRIEFYVPTHKLGQELLALLQQKAPHLQSALMRGRTQPDAEHNTPCRRGHEVTRVSFHGVSIYTSLCRNGSDKCPHFDRCEYLAQYQQEDDVRILTHSHLGLRRGRLEGKRPERAIIDESFWPAMIQTHGYKLSRITESSLQSKALRQTLVTALKSDQPVLERLWHRFGDRLRAVLDAELAWIEGAQLVVAPRMTSQQIETLTRTATNLSFERRLVTALRNEVTQCPDRTESLLIRRTRNGFALVERSAITRFSNGKEADIPVLYIDASLVPRIAQVFLPNLKLRKIDVDRNAEVIQCYSTRNSKMRFLCGSDGQGGQLVVTRHVAATQRFLDKICKDHRVLVVSYERVVGNRKKDIPSLLKLPEHCAAEHFGNLRGIDQYKDFDVCVVIGRHQFPSSVLENMAAALWWDSPKALKLSGELSEELRGYRLAQGQLGVYVPVHSDPRVQKLMEQLREGETLQAIDRLRLIHNKRMKTVYILSNLPLPITVDKVASWKELTSAPGRLDQLSEAYPDGVIPLSPTYLHTHHGDLFPTLDAAKKWGERLQGGGVGGGHTHSSVGVSDAIYIDTLIRDCHLLTYRLHGESGRPKKCLCTTPMKIAMVKRRLAQIHGSPVTLVAA